METINNTQVLQELEQERQARLQAEQQVAQLTRQLHRLQQAQSAPELEHAQPMLRLSYQGELLHANASGHQFLESLGARRFPALQNLLLNKAKRLERLGAPASLEASISGKHFLLHLTSSPDKGYRNFFLTDITPRRLAEKALEESQMFVQNITRTIPNIVYIYDLEADRTIYLNKQISNVLGYTDADITAMDGHVFSSIVEPVGKEALYAHAQRMRIASDNEIHEVEYNVLAKDGSVKILSCRESVFKRSRNGQVKQIIGSAEDITRLRQKSRELARQKDFYESILNHIPSDVAVYDEHLRYLFVNPAAVGDPAIREWIVNKTNEEYCAYRNVPLHRIESRGRHLHRVLEEKRRVEFEENLVDKNGEASYHLRRLNPVLDEEGNVKLIIGHGLNITELHHAQQEIKQSEAKVRTILEAIPDLMFIIDKDGVYLEMHNENEAHLQYDAEEIIGKTIFDTHPDSLSQDLYERVQQVLRTDQMESIDYHLDLPIGTRYYEGRIVKYSDDRVLAIIRDITEERQAAQEVKEKNDFIRLVLDTSPSLIYVRDGKGHFKLANQECAALFGLTPERMIDSNTSEIHTIQQEVAFFNAIDQHVIKYGKEVKVQERFTLPSGSVVWFNTIKKPLVTSDGQVHVLGISTNITEQRSARKRLERSEELHRLLSENSRDLICLHDPDGTYLYVSRAAEEMLGYKPDELVGTSPYEIVHPQDSQNVLVNGHERTIQTRNNIIIQHRLRHKNGTYVWMETSIRPIMDSSGEVMKLQSASRDITDRRLSEDALKNSEKKYRDLIKYSQAYICTHDMEGRILAVNPYLMQMLGYTEQEIVGKELKNFFPLLHRQHFPAYLEQIQTNRVVDGVLCILNKQKEERYLYYQNYKVSEEGQEAYVIGIAQDITDRMQTERELKKAKEAAEESARVKENFLANMSHEIRTPLNGILGMAGLLNKTPLKEDQQNYLKIINQSADNLLVVINDILDIAKIESGKLELESIPFHVDETVQAAFQTLRYKAEEKEIALVLGDQQLGHTVLEGDPYRLNQILLNLLNNAIKFTDEGSVTLSARTLEETSSTLTIEFAVTDTGIGVPEDKKDFIFEGFTQAYSSTTRKYGGTGLGLSICKNLVERQGGDIWVENNPTGGSTFKFMLTYPKSSKTLPEATEQTAIDFRSLGEVRVLLAEDNEVNVFLAKAIMEDWGFKLDVAVNGQEAVELVNQHTYDIILMDIQMPELSGIDATHIIREHQDERIAQLPIIALTANALKGDAEKYLNAGMNDYVSKPFEEEVLFSKIAALLPHKLSGGKLTVPGKAIQTSTLEPMYSLDVIRKMSRNNTAFLNRAMQLFTDTVPGTVQDMRLAVQREDWQQVSSLAHKLKSTIDTMKIGQLREMVRFIEGNARQQTHLSEVSTSVEELCQVMLQVVDQVRENIPELN
ncbi:PAS domain-containing hybrid sensor histidine kinase/response regulator [Pontibacter roseus]|uniref:PAS domain-containing hybrid sensor histidine kinase/response regulator n=1 Tax=Pontibacter roseus TaxID=336989 RepID=UPI000380D658|nr:PAS domain S-box protein [Pontibacter roseus]